MGDPSATFTTGLPLPGPWPSSYIVLDPGGVAFSLAAHCPLVSTKPKSRRWMCGGRSSKQENGPLGQRPVISVAKSSSIGF